MNYIAIQKLPDEVIEFIKMPNSIYKNFLYYNKFKSARWITANTAEDDNFIHFATTQVTINRSKDSYYTKESTKTGFTYDKSVKKVKMWFRGNVRLLNLDFFIQAYPQHNWIEPRLHDYITTTILAKIISGTITNPIDLLQAYCKSVRIECSTALLYKIIKKGNVERPTFIGVYPFVKDINHVLEYLENHSYFQHPIGDIVEQAKILNKKIDFKWSIRRFEEEHAIWTKEIMALELDNLEDELIEYPEFSIPREFELLASKRRIFQEGTLMHHCIYTNYYNSIKKKTYLAFHIVLNGEEATLGCIANSTGITLNQLYQKYDRPVSIQMRTFCENWVKQNKDLIITF